MPSPAARAGRCGPTRRARRSRWRCSRCRSRCRPTTRTCCGGPQMADLVLYELRPPAAVLTINRPDKRNALSRALIAALGDAFRRAADDPAARCVILTGSGTAFCAGMDLDELRGTLGAGAEKVWDDAAKLSTLYDFIYALPKPTIAAVNGAAVAGGAGLVSVCDLALSVPDAKFGYPE